MGKTRLGDPLAAVAAVGRQSTVKEPRWHQGRLFWLEQRPQQQGRTTLICRTTPDAAAIELTPPPWNLRSRVHGFGGGSYAVGLSGPGITVLVFSHDGDRCLWCLELPATGPLEPGPVRRLCEPAERDFAGGLIDARRGRWIGVMEADGTDRLVAVPLGGGEPLPLHPPVEFCGYAALSPSGDQLAWVEWQQPFMPWERAQLKIGRFNAEGVLEDARRIAGALPSTATDAAAQACSVFQPLWLPNGDLVVANDRSGWWNLERLVGTEQRRAATGPPGTHQPLRWQALLPMQAEFAMPQWVEGMATTAWDGEQLVAAACEAGHWSLGRIALPSAPGAAGVWQPIELPFDDLACLQAENGRLVAVASGPTIGSGLLELDLASGVWCHTPAAGGPGGPLPPAAISVPEPFWFAGHGGLPTHAWYYPPQGGAHPAAPLLVKGHSGPTAMARTGLNLLNQFWTSRGWGVVDVNYGGSTGFGRAYRERLDGQWGVVDVADCAAAAQALVAAGQADAGRVAIEGGSAGGFTVLAALCFTDVFRAGACRYGVADLAALVSGTHRFEARYLDGLVGPWPSARPLYDQRSPLHHAAAITCPVIFFQGLKDTVVPPDQTEWMARALLDNGVTVEVHLFPDEGHGFRSGAVQLEVLEATEAFFRRQFQL
ncbi:S9 family peptidase [Synechococcus sp. CS-1324]|uniref:alpha/beta hydrolase family protein n=1 Tax=Synechococcus sp. CS-1324 TaxID=2847980 RepID=UPI00223B6784|nr:prolyl oligopeptidase family serine peptidase [Synechococcus sp. CS-1324]